MDWSRAGEASLQLELDNLRAFRGGWPRFDWRYYAEVEAILQRWLSEMRAAGVVSPISLAIGLLWLYGFGSARLPTPLRWLFALSTVLWTLGALQDQPRNEQR